MTLPLPLSSTPHWLDLDLRLHVQDGERHFDLSVQLTSSAQTVAILGPSGAGKSLTLQTVAGLRRPDQGHVRIAGQTWFDTDRGVNLPTAQRRLGYLFQDYALFPHLSVRENIGFGLTTWYRPWLQPAQAERVAQLLASFQLEALANARPAQLSGGQRQRVALARALASEPQVLLLDEPFSALHPSLRSELRQELRGVLQRTATPVLMITHDIEDVIALADVVCVIEDGRLVHEVDLREGSLRQQAQQALAARWTWPANEIFVQTYRHPGIEAKESHA